MMKSAMAKSTTVKKASKKSEAKLYLAHSAVEPKPQSKYQAGDMDMLESYDKPMPAVFQQIDKTYKAAHSFFGWPLPIV